jgi:hypothetical protein|uniref:MIF4G domain-containing protein n=1 Tax=viral metagenome TaxID=1070528 RepID=A0A6C0AK38_9ZZZZ
MSMIKKQYTYDFFEKFANIDHEQYVTNDVINIINELANKVGAPNYNKTPNFQKSYKKKKHLSKEDWDAIRNYKPTILEKNIEGIDADIDKIRSYLNKMTDDNYQELYIQIKDVINNYIDNKESLNKIGNIIFEMSSINSFWSKLYAKLYKCLIEDYEIMKEICYDNFHNFMELFEKIEYVSPEQDYDKFCQINKTNEKRKALSKFFINLMNNNIIEKEEIISIIMLLIEVTDRNLEISDSRYIIEEISENLYILIIDGKNHIETHDEWDNIIGKMEYFSLLNIKEYAGISSKSLFKYMDIYEEIE